MKKTKEMIKKFSDSKKDLFKNGIIRSERVTGEIGEYLACLQFANSKLAATTSNPGWDIKVEIENQIQKIQVKSHAKGLYNNARWSEVKNIHLFDYLFIVIFNSEYHVKELYNIPTHAIKAHGKLNKDRGIYLIPWDKFKIYQVPPNESVKEEFQIINERSPIPPTPPIDINILGEYDHEEGNTPWEVLTKVTSKSQILFAPRIWKGWNVSEDGVFNTGRKLVFELYKRKTDWKITLRGLTRIDNNFQNFLLETANHYQWQIQNNNTGARLTRGYIKWDRIQPENHKKIPHIQQIGFADENAFFTFLQEWDNLIGDFANNPSRLWQFICQVNNAYYQPNNR
jgi:hypothetical protein